MLGRKSFGFGPNGAGIAAWFAAIGELVLRGHANEPIPKVIGSIGLAMGVEVWGEGL